MTIESDRHQGGTDKVVTVQPEVLGAAEFAGFAPAANAQALLNTSSKSSGSFVLTDAAIVAAAG